jgi:hypothetical protein
MTIGSLKCVMADIDPGIDGRMPRKGRKRAPRLLWDTNA